MKLEKKLRIKFDDAYKWLHLDKTTSDSELSSFTRALVRHMNEALDRKSNTKVWEIRQRLLNFRPEMRREEELAEVLVQCGRAAYEMGSLEDAAAIFHEVVKIYGKCPHEKAAVSWLRGYILWSLPTRHDDAISAWQTSIDEFKKLASPTERSCTTRLKPEWYKKQLGEMREDLQTAIQCDCFPDADVPPDVQRPVTISRQSYLRLFPVAQAIKAGFGSGSASEILKAKEDYSDYLEVDQVLINNEPYRVHNLHSDDRIVNLLKDGKFIVLRVSGNSMNGPDEAGRPGIDDGDYVLLRPRADADYYDIVAAEIVDVDDVAILKRLVEKDGARLLRAESTDPDFQGEKEFSKPNDRFYIRGVALAVLKPL